MKSLFRNGLAAVSVIAMAACATMPADDAKLMADAAAKPAGSGDPREGLGGGILTAEVASMGVRKIASVGTPDGFGLSPEEIIGQDFGSGRANAARTIAFANSDIAFSGDRVIMGSFHGVNVFDLSDPQNPETLLSLVCPGGQGDVSVYGNLLFYSVEQGRGRVDCGQGGVSGSVSAERFRGVRIFDITDLSNPVQVAAVQTCRGSHTHTLVPHPTDRRKLYVYNQGTSYVRSDQELPGCSDGQPEENPDTSLYSIDIIEVDLLSPATAIVIDSPRIFEDRDSGEIAGLWRRGDDNSAAPRTGTTNHCHDITVYPEMGLAAGACSGNGILLDISDPASPKRIDEVFDPNMAYWHSATFNHDATKVLYSDEWGGGLAPRCLATDPENWGANTIFDRTEDGLVQRAYYKIAAAQTAEENCVSHNGSLIPVPGRDVMVQAFYQGGLTIFDFTDSAKPFEIGYFDMGPIDPSQLTLAGYWSTYWHNGRIYGSDIVRGMDIFALTPTDHLSANEIAAAMLVRNDQNNPQTQERIQWPDVPVVAKAYLDQLERHGGYPAAALAAARAQVAAWEAGDLDRDMMLELAEGLAAFADANAGDVRAAKSAQELANLLGRVG